MKNKLSPVIVFAGFINFLLFIVKFYIGVRTNSISIYTDGINNLFDSFSLILALVGISLVKKGSSERFPFGFGRAETLTSFIMALIMTGAGFSFAYNSLTRLFNPTPVWYFTKYAVIIGFTGLLKLLLGVVFTIKYRKTYSPVIKTVMLDSYLDLCIVLMTLFSFTVSARLGITLDGFFGLLISLIIAITGTRLIVSSASELIGKSNHELSQEIENAVKSIDNSIVIKDLKVHTYGENKYVTLTLSFAETNKLSVQNIIKNKLSADFNCRSTVEWEE